MLEGLRKRVSSLFLRFIETPEFNPEATRFQIVPMDFEAVSTHACMHGTTLLSNQSADCMDCRQALHYALCTA